MAQNLSLLAQTVYEMQLTDLIIMIMRNLGRIALSNLK